ncbi:hypothetical protein [Methanobrevibacter ruminantium]|uniref:hypothetical protein n=1 Tax=Methanobrevibacter ruminantium TaxID=83816 RepID=UPI001494B5B9|nr:hypothetical protein [Methanobrevibacter ruminantium]
MQHMCYILEIEKRYFYEDDVHLRSVGAFPLNPSEDRENKKEILDFLTRQIIKLLSVV